ncbi:MAG TPA: carboxypeptidase-like regulatory domain-containing protein [Anaerolineaceae bacterium]|nr:carboxypeptidase-like regulatory domain-containing protein [Anaerolineaceae bacterium]
MLTSMNRRIFSLLAACLLLTVLVFAAQPALVTAHGLPSGEQQVGGEGTFVYLPLISNVPPNTISGQVILNGVGASGYVLTLELYDGFNFQKVVQKVTTDENGWYQFANVPSLQAGKHYEVWYENSDNGVLLDPCCLWFWESQPIENNTAVNINFDITNVELAHIQGNLPIPTTFTWSPRPTGPENYQFLLFPMNLDPLYASEMLFYNSYKLLSLPDGFNWGASYHWAVGVYNDQGGFGISRYNDIYFASSGTLDTFSGRVTDSGVGAPGVVLTLELTDRNHWTVVDRTTTSADGSYHFDDVTQPPDGQNYEVWYDNATKYNPFHEERLSFWGAQTINPASTSNIDFDIAEVGIHQLNSQENFPVLFSWSSRSAAPEEYLFTLRGSTGQPYFEANFPDPTNTYLLNILPFGFMLNQQYGWGVWVRREFVGYGHSLLYPITFVESSNDTLAADELQLQANHPQVMRRGQSPWR